MRGNRNRSSGLPWQPGLFLYIVNKTIAAFWTVWQRIVILQNNIAG